MKRIELLAPAGSMANLKAAVSKGADAVYLGMNRFSARDFATNFNKEYLREAIKICKSNNVKTYLAMNTLVKNSELKDYFNQLSFAYSTGIDAVIIQHESFIDIIKDNYKDLKVHISTQAGVMNSEHAKLLKKADRITLARELEKEEIGTIRNNTKTELEIFCHGALCVSISGQCLFSSLLGGRSGNRGKCAQPCRKKYQEDYYLSTKELCLLEKIPEIVNMGINTLKIEGRMRTPSYVATITSLYRQAIDSYYSGSFEITQDMKNKLKHVFTRGFTQGLFSDSKDIFQRVDPSGTTNNLIKEEYKVSTKEIKIDRPEITATLPQIKNKFSKKQLIVRAYSMEDAIKAGQSGADIIGLDIEDKEFNKEKINSKLYAVTPRIMLDKDVDEIKKQIEEKQPDGIIAGNKGILNLNLKIPVILDYNLNTFNDLDLNISEYSIISPELSIKEQKQLRNKNFASLVHGKIRLMTLRHDLDKKEIKDQKGNFIIKKIKNGTEIINGKEIGLLNKANNLNSSLYIDTENEVEEVTKIYKQILNGKEIDDSKIKKKFVLGWSFKGVI